MVSYNPVNGLVAYGPIKLDLEARLQPKLAMSKRILLLRRRRRLASIWTCPLPQTPVINSAYQCIDKLAAADFACVTLKIYPGRVVLNGYSD